MRKTAALDEGTLDASEVSGGKGLETCGGAFRKCLDQHEVHSRTQSSQSQFTQTNATGKLAH